MKKFVKKSLSKVKKNVKDRSFAEEQWAQIYQNSKNSKFYSEIKNLIKNLPTSKLALEHGCSVGILSEFLSEHTDLVFGIDSSFTAINDAKKTKRKNIDFFVADSVFHPFGKQKFDLVLALNLLEIIEPAMLLRTISSQVNSGHVIISDPYDYERGQDSVKHPLNPIQLRQKLETFGFEIQNQNKKPSFVSWNLKKNPRTSINYKVDIIAAKKSRYD